MKAGYYLLRFPKHYHAENHALGFHYLVQVTQRDDHAAVVEWFAEENVDRLSDLLKEGFEFKEVEIKVKN